MPDPFYAWPMRRKASKFWEWFVKSPIDQKPYVNGTIEEISAITAFAIWCDDEDQKSIKEQSKEDREFMMNETISRYMFSREKPA